MHSGDKVGIVCCSNGQKRNYAEKIKYLETVLLSIGIQPCFSACIYEKENVFSGSAEERARALMKFYSDGEIKEIFDISGGDIANGVLPYLDYTVIANCEKRLWGYSDLTTVLNAIYAKTGREAVLYQVRNLIYEHKEEQIKNFKNSVINGGNDLFQLKCRFIRKNEMHGIAVGGNIRCFLKLAGTEFMPDLQDKILVLEGYAGTTPRIETYLRQLQQLGAFKKVAGILLGTFTQMEADKCIPTVETLVSKIAGKDLPIAVTRDIGHGADAKAIVIGRELSLSQF